MNAPQSKAVYMPAPDSNCQKRRKPLPRGGRPYMPLKFHPAAIRASAVFDTSNGAMEATGGNAKLPHCVALEPVAAMIPA